MTNYIKITNCMFKFRLKSSANTRCLQIYTQPLMRESILRLTDFFNYIKI